MSRTDVRGALGRRLGSHGTDAGLREGRYRERGGSGEDADLTIASVLQCCGDAIVSMCASTSKRTPVLTSRL